MMHRSGGDRAAAVNNVQRLMYVVAFLDLAGVMMVIPLFVTHLRDMGMSPLMNGAVRSFYGVLQLVSSPLVGRWSDRWGRRPLLLVCLALSAQSYLILGTSTSLWVVIGSRIITGIFKHSTTLCKAVLADVTPPEDRPGVMGRFHMAMGIAIILSPAIGALCFVLLPSEMPLHVQTEEAEASKGHPGEKETATRPQNQLISLLKDIDWRVFSDIFLVDFFLTFSSYAFRSNFVLMIDENFGASPTAIGYIISFQGVVGAAAGFFTGRVSQYFGDSQVVLFNSALMQAAALLGLTFTPSIMFTVMLLVPLSISGTLIRTATSTIIIDRSSPSKIGSVTGVAQIIPAIAGMTTPVLAGLVQEAGLRGPGLLASGAAILGAAAAGWAAHFGHSSRQAFTKVT
ncbi:Major facilitator superfamily domain-containing protein 9 [Chionoecetes opilio]|uniref:Major facilitator superfamily domain-containing protein 9 n=1 Tax=Chionoecetes opilio TaxID=41210 RepID=A0A8J4Y519_CHIOP|nr:Major facilitator superfamily domain-containing protein 9 [Chionoecetes opilio]